MTYNHETVKIKEIFSADKEFSLFSQLYRDAFPDDERMPLSMIRQNMNTGRMRTFLVYDETSFIGFYNMIFHEQYAYLAYFAIEPQYRHIGYGSDILKIIRQQFDNYTICFDIEYTDEKAENYQERLDRYHFYRHNGFYDTGNLIYMYGVDYTIMASDPHMTAEEYLSIFLSMNIRGFNYVIKRRGKSTTHPLK